MNLKPHLKLAFLFSIICNLVVFFVNPIMNEGNWTKITMAFLISVLFGTVILAILRSAGYAMIKSFTDPEDGPLS